MTHITITKVKTFGGIDEVSNSRFHNVTIRDNGTIWIRDNTIPIVTPTANLDRESLKALHEKGAFDQIPDENYIRIGKLENGCEVLFWEDFAKRKAPFEAAKRNKEKLEAMRRLSVHLSSRGWCDFSPVVWSGDFETPIEDIVAQCQKLLKEGFDVDFADQSDQQIKDKILEAQSQRKAKKAAWDDAYQEALKTIDAADDSTKAAFVKCKGDADDLYDGIDNLEYWAVDKLAWALGVKSAYEQAYD